MIYSQNTMKFSLQHNINVFDSLEVHNNTMAKYDILMTHTINTVMLKFIDIFINEEKIHILYTYGSEYVLFNYVLFSTKDHVTYKIM